jgi:hypothetical protein
MVILKAKAQNNILAEDYEQWNGTAQEWTPYSSVNKMVKARAKGIETQIHPQLIIPTQVQEKLAKCNFHLATKKAALELHKQGRFIPDHTDISIWTDGNLSREGAVSYDDLICGVAATVHIHTIEENFIKETTPIITNLMIPNAVSSYETEIIAIQAGSEAAKSENPIGRAIHLFTDSLSCLQKLECLPFKYKYTNAAVADDAEKLTELAENSTVDLHFIPSHTNEIPESDAIN